jgi:hypothetical protein
MSIKVRRAAFTHRDQQDDGIAAVQPTPQMGQIKQDKQDRSWRSHDSANQ